MIDLLPLEILVHIGLESPRSWRAMLAISPFARWTLSSHARLLRKTFITIKDDWSGKSFYLLCELHNFDDLPACDYVCDIENDAPDFKIELRQHTLKWYQRGFLHRDDGPAVTKKTKIQRLNKNKSGAPHKCISSKYQEWYQRGRLHRDDGPAIISISNGSSCFRGKKPCDNDSPVSVEKKIKQYWYRRGFLHRDDDLPAVIYSDGTQEWWQNGLRFRANDGPTVIDAKGRQKWHKNGLLHRDDDKPAVIWENGTQEWYQNGDRFREKGGPTVIDAKGRQIWHRNGTIVRSTLSKKTLS